MFRIRLEASNVNLLRTLLEDNKTLLDTVTNDLWSSDLECEACMICDRIDKLKSGCSEVHTPAPTCVRLHLSALSEQTELNC